MIRKEKRSKATAVGRRSSSARAFRTHSLYLRLFFVKVRGSEVLRSAGRTVGLSLDWTEEGPDHLGPVECRRGLYVISLTRPGTLLELGAFVSGFYAISKLFSGQRSVTTPAYAGWK